MTDEVQRRMAIHLDELKEQVRALERERDELKRQVEEANKMIEVLQRELRAWETGNW